MHGSVEEMQTVGGNVLARDSGLSDWPGGLEDPARQFERQQIQNFTGGIQSWQVGRDHRSTWRLINVSRIRSKKETCMRSGDRHERQNNTRSLPPDHLLPKSLKHILGEWLGEEISELVVSVDLAHVDPIARVGRITFASDV